MFRFFVLVGGCYANGSLSCGRVTLNPKPQTPLSDWAQVGSFFWANPNALPTFARLALKTLCYICLNMILLNPMRENIRKHHSGLPLEPPKTYTELGSLAKTIAFCCLPTNYGGKRTPKDP